MCLVYDELRKVASRLMANQVSDHTLQPTALVNEVSLCLMRHRDFTWENRASFFSFAAEAMRNVLVSHARAKLALKRGGQNRHIPVDLIDLPWEPEMEPARLLDLDSLLRSLGEKDHRLAKIIELRFFLGCTEDETAQILGVARSTVQREWRVGKRLVAARVPP